MTSGNLSLKLVVSHRRPLARAVTEFELRDAGSGTLPRFAAGAHVNIRAPSGDVRSYSLTNDPVDRHRYVIAVKCLKEGRGGSASITSTVREGQIIAVSPPRNTFPLVAAPRLLLIAGGIGITAIISMARVLSREKHADYRLIYCIRRPNDAAYLDDLRSIVPNGRLVIHHSHVGRLDFWPYVETPDVTHVYCCGPDDLMKEVRSLTVHWPATHIHFETFAGVASVGEDSRAFRIRRASDGIIVDVAADETILDALAARNIDWPASCRSGTCGTCRMRLVSGSVEHRDLFLSDAEKTDSMMPCVSRAAGDDDLVLDF